MKRFYRLTILVLLLLLSACGKTSEAPPKDTGTDKQVDAATHTVSESLDVIEAMKSVQAADFKNPNEFGNITAQQLATALNHAGLSPAYIEVAEFDCLHDDGVLYAELLRSNGIPVEFHESKGTMHGFDTVFNAPTSQAMLKKRTAYIRRMFSR